MRTRTGVRVTAIDEHGVELRTSRGVERIAARTVLWAAGVAASPFGAVISRRTGCELGGNGRVAVTADLSVPGHPEILVIGDLALAKGEKGKPLPGSAPVAMQQGRFVADVIRRRLAGNDVPEFRYRDRGSMATIGRASAVAQVAGLKYSGYPAWLTWLFVHLMYLVGFQNRVLVFLQWAFYYFTFHRGARLIAPQDTLSDESATEPTCRAERAQV